MGANRAYLAGESSGVKGYAIEWDDATGLNDLSDLMDSNDLIYNLAGQRVNKAQKGIYIVNGKKIAIK